MDHELKALRKELAVLGDEFSQRIKLIERRIDQLESKSIWNETEDVTSTSNAQKTNGITNYVSSNELESSIVEPPEKVLASVVAEERPAQFKAKETTFHSDTQFRKTASDWELYALSNEVGRQSLFALIAPLLGPLVALIGMFSKVYRHYQEQGKAPVFFMTATGIIALVLGFGYLLQYSFNEYLGPTGKVIIGFLCAIAFIAGGIRLIRKNDDMAEYGSSVIALGLILSFLSAYFAGPYYGLLPSFWGFLLLVAVTAVAYFFALIFETRVVAIVTLIGGIAMPIVMGHVDYSPALYLSYLLILAVAMLKLSYRIEWTQLAYVSMALSAGMIEYSILNLDKLVDLPIGLVLIIHGFFYAYAYYALRGLNLSGINKPKLMIITSNLFFYIFFAQQLISDNLVLGTVLLVNLLPWVGLFLVPAKVFNYALASDPFRTVQAIALLKSGILLGVGILVLSSPDLLGVIWSLEALLLVYLGGKFKFSSVRAEGYVALLIAVFMIGTQIILWLEGSIVSAPELLNLELGVGWGNLVALSLILYACVWLLTRFQEHILDIEHKLLIIIKNALYVALSLSILLTIGLYTEAGMWLFAIVPMFLLIWCAKQEELVVTELIGLGHFLLLVIPILASAIVVGNYHFTEQNIFAQIARVEIFVSLWLVAEFYRRYFPESRNIKFTEGLRKIFYCLIPLLFLPKVLREYSGYLPIALWLSSIIALFLYSRLQYKVLMIELRILVTLASVSAIVSCGLVEFTGWTGNALGALAIGLVFHALTAWYGKALQRTAVGSNLQIKIHDALKPMFTVAVFYFGFALFIIGYKVSTVLELGMFMAMFYFTSFFFVSALVEPVRKILRPIYLIVLALFCLLTISHCLFAAALYVREEKLMYLGIINTLAVLIVGMLVFKPKHQVRVVWQKTGQRILNLWFFNLITVGAYIPLLSQLFTDMLGPVISFFLVAHATIILLLTLDPKFKKLIWLSGILYGVAALKVLFWDMSDFSLIQKIVVFMLIGVCMLGAAFKFQKMSAKSQKSGLI
jgi:hypothetical protein